MKSKKNNLSVWRVFQVCVLLLIISVIGVNNKEEVYEPIIAYKEIIAKYNEIDYVTNLLSNYKDNIVISPYYKNSVIAYLYSLDKDNEYYSNYFDDNLDNVNNYYLSKISKYKYIDKDKSKKELYCDKLHNTYYKKEYDKLNITRLSKMGTYDKNDLLLLINKIKLCISNTKLKDIKKYELTNKDKDINTVNILNNIKYLNYYYDTYKDSNKINLISDVYSKNKVKENKYLINTYKGIDTKKINSNMSKESNNLINYIVNDDIYNYDNVYTGSLLFNYRWDKLIYRNNNSYEDYYIKNNIYSVEMLNFVSDNYLESNTAIGFIKDYESSKYSFIGILPKDGYDINNISIKDLLNKKQDVSIDISIPKFSITYKDILDIDNNIIIEKNSFTLGENGTSNANYDYYEQYNYATLSNIERIVFNKPFYFIVIDNDNNTVLLAGKVNNPLE